MAYKYLLTYLLTYLKPDTYSKPSQRFKIEFFVKIVKSYNHFSKALSHRSLTGYWIRSSLNKCSLTCRVNSRYILLRHIDKPDTFKNLSIIVNIQAYSGILTSYSDISSHIMASSEPCVTFAYSKPYHIQNPGIFRTRYTFGTLPGYILTYSERCVTLTYSEPYHIQNFDIFRKDLRHVQSYVNHPRRRV